MKRYLIAFLLLHLSLGFARDHVLIDLSNQIHFTDQELNQKNKRNAELLKETANAFLQQFVEYEYDFLHFASYSRKNFSDSLVQNLFFLDRNYFVQSNFFFKEMLVTMLFPKHYFF